MVEGLTPRCMTGFVFVLCGAVPSAKRGNQRPYMSPNPLADKSLIHSPTRSRSLAAPSPSDKSNRPPLPSPLNRCVSHFLVLFQSHRTCVPKGIISRPSWSRVSKLYLELIAVLVFITLVSVFLSGPLSRHDLYIALAQMPMIVS